MDRTKTGGELANLFFGQISQKCGPVVAAVFTPRLATLFDHTIPYAELERTLDNGLRELSIELDEVRGQSLVNCKEEFLQQVGLASLTFHAAARPEIMGDHMNLAAVVARYSPNLTVSVIETAVSGINDIAKAFGTAEPEAKAIALFANSSLAVRLAATTFPEIPESSQ